MTSKMRMWGGVSCTGSRLVGVVHGRHRLVPMQHVRLAGSGKAVVVVVPSFCRQRRVVHNAISSQGVMTQMRDFCYDNWGGGLKHAQLHGDEYIGMLLLIEGGI